MERTESLDGEPYQLDLCEVCDKAFEDAAERVRAWLRRGVPRSQAEAPPRRGPGRPRKTKEHPGPPRNRPEFNTVYMRTCPECGYECPTRTALGQHVKAKHDHTLSEYDWRPEPT